MARWMSIENRGGRLPAPFARCRLPQRAPATLPAGAPVYPLPPVASRHAQPEFDQQDRNGDGILESIKPWVLDRKAAFGKGAVLR
jgi:hypothetical protein